MPFAKNFLSAKSDFDFGVGSYSDPPPPVRCTADISDVGAIVQWGIAGAISLSFDKQWRKVMRANRKSYATAAVRAWLRGRHKIRLQQQPFSMVA